MSANNSSTFNALGNNTSGTTTTPPLLRLPNELIEMVAEQLKRPADLISMRSTCSHLRNGSAMTFSKLCFNTRTQISGTGSSIRHMTDVLLSPNLLGAQHLARSLNTKAPEVYPNWPVDLADLHEHLSPSPEDIARLFAAMPKLDAIFLSERNAAAPNAFHEQKLPAVRSAPILLRSLAIPGSCLPQLRRMCLLHVCVEAAVLVRVLEQHKHSLDVGWLCFVRTTGTASWVEVLKSLRSTDVSTFGISWPESVDDSGNCMRVVFPLGAQLTEQGPGSEELVHKTRVEVDKKHVKPVLDIIVRAFESSVWLEEGSWF